MRLFVGLMFAIFCVVAVAQEPALVPVAPAKKEEKKTEPKKEEKKEEGTDYQQLYQQYLQKYNPNATPAPAPAPAPAPKPEPAPAPAPAPLPAPAPVPKPEPAPAPAPAPVPAPAPMPEPAPAPAPVEPIPAPAPVPAPMPEPKPVPAPAPKPMVPDHFTLSMGLVGQLANGISLFGGEVLHNSYQFEVPQAVVDLKGGTDSFTVRLAVDFLDGLVKQNRVITPNYAYDKNVAGSTPDIATLADVVDMVKDVSFHFPNIGGYYIEVKGGKFGLPFGVENTMYDHEIPFYFRPLAFERYLGGGFNDLGLQVGANVPLSDTMGIKARYFLFNGRNEAQLDGGQYIQDPAHGIDVRFEMSEALHTTSALSLIIGSAYHDMDTENPNGIIKTALNRTDPVSGEPFGYLYDVPTQEGSPVYLKDFIRNKMNILLTLGTDIGYRLDENMDFGMAAEFYYSYRQLFNPTKVIDQDRNPATSDLFSYRFLEDASGNYYGNSYYQSYGFFAAPYAHLWDFDATVRFSYSKQPYLYTFVEDQKNSVLGLELMVNYNVTKYFQVGFDWRWMQENFYKYDPAIDLADNGVLDYNYVKDTYNTHLFLLHAAFNYETLLVK